MNRLFKLSFIILAMVTFINTLNAGSINVVLFPCRLPKAKEFL